MTASPRLAALGLVTLLVLPPSAMAGDGHDHGDTAAQPAGPGLPRFAAVSDVFELVGVLDGKQITLYLDRAADNSPVAAAQIELDISGQKYQAAARDGAVFAVVLPNVPAPGVLPVVATVSAGAETDLLAGELDIHGPAPGDAAADHHGWQDHASVLTWAMAGLAALAVVVVVVVVVVVAIRRVFVARKTRIGGAA